MFSQSFILCPFDPKTINDLITTNGGNVSDQGVWQKRKLAYQIDTFNEGIYTITSFEGPGNIPGELDRVLKISDDVIRHKVLKMESQRQRNGR